MSDNFKINKGKIKGTDDLLQGFFDLSGLTGDAKDEELQGEGPDLTELTGDAKDEEPQSGGPDLTGLPGVSKIEEQSLTLGSNETEEDSDDTALMEALYLADRLIELRSDDAAAGSGSGTAAEAETGTGTGSTAETGTGTGSRKPVPDQPHTKVQSNASRCRKLKQYVRPVGYDVGCMFIIIPAVLLFAVARKNHIFVILFALLCLGLFCGRGILRYLRMRRTLKEAKASGELDALLDDFDMSRSFLKDHLRLGQTYLFAKRRGEIIPYKSLTGIRAEKKKSDYTYHDSELFAETADRKKVSLCFLHYNVLRDDNYTYEDIYQTVIFIKGHQPSLKIDVE